MIVAETFLACVPVLVLPPRLYASAVSFAFCWLRAIVERRGLAPLAFGQEK